MNDKTAYDPHPRYRPELDGMRAIAVLAVVGYHFGVPGTRGGLVGVDIFFVLSGFLIGGILWRERMDTGGLRLRRFYLRRIRRLAPAYFAMSAAALVAAWFILLPFDLREFGKELIAATTYLANVHFFRETGYFDTGIENKILLHAWSLAVEEQFYLVLPLVILVLGRRPRLLRRVLVALLAGSLAGSLWLVRVNQAAAFYLFAPRAWELLAGVVLAVYFAHARGARWMSWAGLALMAAGIFGARPGPGYPGWQVAVPVAGAVLAIAGGQAGGLANRALSMAGPVFVGRISYSLYLWHWPVLTLSKYWRGGYSGPAEAAGWAALALALSVLSWRFVEEPVRRSVRISGRLLIVLWLAGSAMLLGAGAVLYLSDGAPWRYRGELRALVDASGDFLQDWSRCTVASEGPLRGVETCPIGPPGVPELLIWGDSHVRAIKEGLERAAWEANRPGVIVWVAGCPPLFGVSKQENTTSAREDATCRATTARLREAARAGALPARLLLVGRWSYYAEGRGVGLDAANRVVLRDASGATEGVYGRAMAATLAELAGAFSRVFVLRQPPELPRYDSRQMAREMAAGRLSAQGVRARASVPIAAALARAARGQAPLSAAAREGVIRLVDPWPRFCDATRCSAFSDGKALYFDTNHLDNSGGMAIRDLLAPAFGEAP